MPGGSITATDSGTIEAQASRLGDPRLQTVQRQTLAAQIGRVQGNRHLQRVVASLQDNDKRVSYQSNIAVRLQRSRASDGEVERAGSTEEVTQVVLQRNLAGDEEQEQAHQTEVATQEKEPIVSVSMDFGPHLQQPHWGSARRGEPPSPFASRAVRERPQPAAPGMVPDIQAQDVKVGGLSFFVTDFTATVAGGLKAIENSKGISLESKKYTATGEVKIIGPKSRVGQWDLGFLQTVYRSDRNYYYDGPNAPRIKTSDVCTVLPVRDWLSGKQPWYDETNVSSFSPLPESTQFSYMYDTPKSPRDFIPWKDPQGNSLHRTDGMDIFRCWLTVRNRVDSSKRYLRFADWQVNYATTVNTDEAIGKRVAPKGNAGAKVTQRGKGQDGGKVPRLFNPTANEVSMLVSTPW